MSERYKVRNNTSIYFVTCTITHWIDLFTREIYKQLVLESLNYCQINKGLTIHSWVIMSNHIHFVASSCPQPLNTVIKEFKQFTSK